MIEIHQLTRSFGDFRAVDGLSFRVAPGEVLGFLGPNGAGKSTTMKMLTGFLTPTSGSVSVCGHDLAKEPLAAKRCMGYLPEGAPAWGDMRVLPFLEFMADMRGLHGELRAQRLQAVIAQVALEEVLDQPIDTLSKGFKRRVGLAQAILHDPQVLILDEPTDGLDPNQKHQVRELIKSMARDKIIIVSTHILEEVTAVCTRAVIIARGKLLADGTPQELLARSRLHGAVRFAAAIGEADAQSLVALPGVDKVEALSTGVWRVLPRAGAQIVGDVVSAVRNKGWTVSELQAETGQLDEVFRHMTQGV